MLTKSVAGRTWQFSHSIGHFVGPEGFTHSTPVTSTADGVLYVADTGLAEYGGGALGGGVLRRLRIEDEFLAEMGRGDLIWPEGLALCQDGNVWCTDAYQNFVVGYDREGNESAAGASSARATASSTGRPASPSTPMTPPSSSTASTTASSATPRTGSTSVAGAARAATPVSSASPGA